MLVLPRTWRVLGCALAALAASPPGDPPRAPDGHRGLGAETETGELLKLLRSTSEAERRFLAGLAGLEGEIRELEAGWAARCRELGYFELEGAAGAARGADLDRLDAACERARRDPMAILPRADASARSLARMLLDTRFNVRRAVSAGWEREAREVRGGLAVLRGAAEGYVELSARESSAIAARVDLSASLLRALRNDLRVLRPSAADPGDDAALARAAEDLLAAAKQSASGKDTKEVTEARARIRARLATARALELSMADPLFTSRLRPELQGALDDRGRLAEAAARLCEQARIHLPDTPEGAQAPPDIQRLERGERMRWAAFRAREGLSLDPLDAELAWAAAHAADYHEGTPGSRPLFDRFLVLRGIRFYDHATLGRRALDAREKEALAAVQRRLDPTKQADKF